MQEPYLNSSIARVYSTYLSSNDIFDLSLARFINDVSWHSLLYGLVSSDTILISTELTPIGVFYERFWFMRKVDFVTIRISNDLKEHFLGWVAENQDDYADIKTTLAQAGYKFSISYDPERDCFITAMTGTIRSTHNKSHCITSRSNDMFEAEMMMLYKHIVIAGSKEWLDVATQGDNWG